MKQNSIEKNVRPHDKKPAIRYIHLAIVTLCLMILTGVFVLQRLVYAYSEQKVYEPYDIALSQRVFDDFQNDYSQLFTDDLPDQVIDMFPHPSYNSDVAYYLYDGYYGAYSQVGRMVWSHARDLYRRGLIHGSDTDMQCTFFAQMWFYDIYGFNSSGNGATGNGDGFAYRVYQSAVYYNDKGELEHLFKIDDHPETMGIVSVAGPTPHVLCVDEVDYANDTITISDGNVNNYGEVRIRQTYTMNQFYNLFPGRYIYVNPTVELLKMIGAFE